VFFFFFFNQKHFNWYQAYHAFENISCKNSTAFLHAKIISRLKRKKISIHQKANQTINGRKKILKLGLQQKRRNLTEKNNLHYKELHCKAVRPELFSHTKICFMINPKKKKSLLS